MAGAFYSGARWRLRHIFMAPYGDCAIWCHMAVAPYFRAIWRLRHIFMAPYGVSGAISAPYGAKMAPYGAILNGAIFILSNGAVNGDI